MNNTLSMDLVQEPGIMTDSSTNSSTITVLEARTDGSSRLHIGPTYIHNYRKSSLPSRGTVLFWLTGKHDFRERLDETLADARRIQQRVSESGTDLDLRHELLDSVDFQRWLSGDEQYHKLWYSGAPGAGKSVFASIVIHNLLQRQRDHSAMSTNTDKESVAYAFLRHSRQYGLAHLLGIIIRQVIGNDELPTSLLDLWKECDGGQQEPTESQLSRVLSVCARDRRVYIVIDGVDEADDETSRDLISRLSHDLDLRLLITSRQSRTMTSISEGFIKAKVYAHDADLTRFITNAIDASTNLRTWCDRDPTLRHDILTGVRSSCDSIFLLARLHMEKLVRAMRVGEVRRALTDLPDKVDDVYEQTLRRIEEMEERERTLALDVLSWVLFTHRPLRVPELQHALEIAPGNQTLDPDSLLSEDLISAVCLGLIKFGATVNFIHVTAVRYLLRAWSHALPAHHAKISRVCIAYLSLTVFQQPPPRSQPYPMAIVEIKDKATLSLRQKYQQYPLIEYAVGYLKHHLFYVQDNALAPQVQHELRELLVNRHKRSFYIEALMGRDIVLNTMNRSIIHLDFISPDEKRQLMARVKQSYSLVKHETREPTPRLSSSDGSSSSSSSSDSLATTIAAAANDDDDPDEATAEIAENNNNNNNNNNNPKQYVGGILTARTKNDQYAEYSERVAQNGQEVLDKDNSVTLSEKVAARYQQYVTTLSNEARDLDSSQRVEKLYEILQQVTTELISPLHLAARLGWEPILDSLLPEDTDGPAHHPRLDINAADPTGASPLQIAINHSHWNFAMALLSHGAYCDFSIPQHHRLLHYVASQDQLDHAKAMVLNGADTLPAVTWFDVRLGGQYLHQVIQWVVGMLCQLLAALGLLPPPLGRSGSQQPGVSPDASYETGIQLLRAVALMRTHRAARIIAKYWDSPEPDPGQVPPRQFCETAMYLAMVLDAADVVEALLDAGFPLTHRCPERNTLLHLAVRADSAQTVRLLLARGIDVEARNGEYYTAWGYALGRQKGKQSQVLDMLIASGAHRDPRGGHGTTQLYGCAARGDLSAVKNILSVPDMDATSVTAFGWTPLHWGALTGVDMARLLIEAGADMNAQSDTNKTPLDMLSPLTDEETYRYMREKGALHASEMPKRRVYRSREIHRYRW